MEVILKRTVLFIILCATFCCTTGEQLVAGGFQLNEHGARAMAQAGAFVARAYDPSAIYFNPAGLSHLRGFQLMAGTTMIAPSYTFYGPTNYNSNTQWDMNNNIFFPSNLYLSNTWNDGVLGGLAVGVGVTTPYGLGTEWKDDWVGRGITQEIDLKTFYVMPTVSYAINDMISIGAGANIVISSVLLRKAVTNFNPSMNLHLEGDGDMAFSWNAGVLIKPVEDISLGFTYRAQTNIDFKGTANFSPPASLAALFPGGDVTTGIKLPTTYYAGVAWMPTDDLELELDYQGINWSSYDKLEINFVTDAINTPGVAQADVSSPKNYKDTFIIRFGGEYKLPVMGLKLRAGYFYDRNPVPDEHLEPLLPDADRHGVNIGFGLDLLPDLTLDFAYLDLLFKDRKTDKTSQPDGVYLDGLYTGNGQLFGVNLTYQF